MIHAGRGTENPVDAVLGPYRPIPYKSTFKKQLMNRICEKCKERISSTEIPVGHGDKVVHVHHFANISEAGEWLKKQEEKSKKH